LPVLTSPGPIPVAVSATSPSRFSVAWTGTLATCSTAPRNPPLCFFFAFTPDDFGLLCVPLPYGDEDEDVDPDEYGDRLPLDDELP